MYFKDHCVSLTEKSTLYFCNYFIFVNLVLSSRAPPLVNILIGRLFAQACD